MQDHIKSMTELFNELAIVGDAIEEEDRVVYLLASLPDSFNTLVTALEASEDVPKMEIVTERLLHAERKQKESSSVSPGPGDGGAATISWSRSSVQLLQQVWTHTTELP